MKKESFRDRRVGELLKEEIARIIQYEIKNEELHNVIITEVTVTKDLSLARVYFRSLDNTDLEHLKMPLERAKGFIFTRLKKTITIRRIPTLEFLPDYSIDYGEKIEGLIRKLHQQD
jgi:ribosome-binding factor A